MYVMCFLFVLNSGGTDQQCFRDYSQSFSRCEQAAEQRARNYMGTGLYRSVRGFCRQL